MSAPEGKRFFIEAFFRDLEQRIARVSKIAEMGFVEEGLILSCCHLNGMAQLRYAGVRDDTKLFSQLLREYGGHPEVYERVSKREITHRSDKDPFAPKALHNHAAIAAEIATRLGDEPSVVGDPTEAALLSILGNVPGADVRNLGANLWRYTYGAVLYRRWRGPGVHEGQIDAPWEVETGEKTFRQGDSGEGAYYNTFNRLTFSASLLFDTLQRTFASLRAECLEKNVFPPELAVEEAI